MKIRKTGYFDCDPVTCDAGSWSIIAPNCKAATAWTYQLPIAYIEHTGGANLLNHIDVGDCAAPTAADLDGRAEERGCLRAGAQERKRRYARRSVKPPGC